MMMALTGINDLGYINTFNAYICQMAVGFLLFFFFHRASCAIRLFI